MSPTEEPESYPALLSNLPCIVETHKVYNLRIFNSRLHLIRLFYALFILQTQDKNTYYKSNDVGQVLQVFLTKDERNIARMDLPRHSNLGFQNVLSDGLTAPTSQIVPRKYIKTRPQDHGKYNKRELQEIIDEVMDSSLSEGLLNQPEPIVFQTVEEVVDFEDWMITEDMPKGISFDLEGNEWNKSNIILQEHPEILMTGNTYKLSVARVKIVNFSTTHTCIS